MGRITVNEGITAFFHFSTGDKLKTIHVHLGHSPRNPEKHCSDGDSSYVTGSFENTLVRLTGIDAFEVRGLSLHHLERSGFLLRLDKHLREYLEPKLTTESIRTHKNLGFQARDYFESILEEELTMTFEKEVFDRYERALVYLSAEDSEDTYNLNLVETGYALPYFIYPNAVSPDVEGEWNYDAMQKMRDTAGKAKESNLGIWEYIDDVLLPMELRFLTRRELPAKYCANLENNYLYAPQQYFWVPILDRLFFYPKDVLLAVEHGFRPTPSCDEWLHKAWRGLHGKVLE